MEAVQRTSPAEQAAAFEQFMAGMDRLEKFQQETARQMREENRQMKEETRQLKEAMRKTDLQMQETDRKLSKFGNRLGEMIEAMVKPNLIGKFRELGFVFTKVYQEAEIKDEKNKILAEVDLTLENGDKVMIVEVKSKPTVMDVKDHLKRMETVRRHGDLHGDRRKFLGSVAGMVISDNVRDFALKNGFYVIMPSGDTFTITVPEGIYCPREW